MTHDLQWIEATSVGTRHGEPNQDALWCSPDGRFCLVADGGTRPGQQSEIASATCVRTARDLYRPGAGDDLIERIARAVNSELLHRIASDEPVGSTTLAAVHVTSGSRVLAAIFGDGAVLHVRDTNVVRLVRPLRKYDYYVATEAEEAAADARFNALPWWMQASLTSQLPWASQGIVPKLIELAPNSGDVLVVCTDGLGDALSPRQIAIECARWSQDLAERLVDQARVAGSNDDATCATVRW